MEHYTTPDAGQAPLEVAGELARKHGFMLFPVHSAVSGTCSCGNTGCDAPGKHPWIPRWQDLATNDPGVIENWARSYPNANVGVCAGHSKLLIADWDGPAGSATREAREAEYGPLPSTVTVMTAKGRHDYWRHPGLRVVNHVGILPGLDIRGDGGFVVAPPSTHVKGHIYRYAEGRSPDEVPIAEAPDWLIELATSPRRSAGGEGGVGVASILKGVPRGQRDNMLFQLACKLRKADVPLEAAIELVCKAAANCYDPHTGAPDPFPMDAAIEKVRRVYETYPAGNDAGAAPGAAPTIITATSLANKEIPPQRWSVPGILTEGLALLVGRPKQGKSFLALDLGASIANGALAFEARKVERGDVLYIALEDTERRLQERLAKVGDGTAASDRLHFATDWPRFDNGGLEHLSVWLRAHPEARLVVVDTLAKARSRARAQHNAYDEDYAAMGPIKRVADEHGVCIILVHHTKKGETRDAVESVSGSTGITGAADTLLILDRERGSDSATLYVTGRDVDEQSLSLQWDRDQFTWRLLGDAADYPAQANRREVAAFLRRHGGWHHPREIAAALGRNASTLRSCLIAMENAGQLQRLDGVYAANGVARPEPTPGDLMESDPQGGT